MKLNKRYIYNNAVCIKNVIKWEITKLKTNREKTQKYIRYKLTLIKVIFSSKVLNCQKYTFLKEDISVILLSKFHRIFVLPSFSPWQYRLVWSLRKPLKTTKTFFIGKSLVIRNLWDMFHKWMPYHRILLKH